MWWSLCLRAETWHLIFCRGLCKLVALHVNQKALQLLKEEALYASQQRGPQTILLTAETLSPVPYIEEIAVNETSS